MTQHDLLELLREECLARSQKKVADMLGYSPAAISQVLSGTYKGEPDIILEQVEKVFVQGKTTVDCPARGEVSFSWCAQQRRKPYESVTNPETARLYRACRKCPQNGGKS